MSQSCTPLNCAMTCEDTLPLSAYDNCTYVTSNIAYRHSQRLVLAQTEIHESSGPCQVTFMNRRSKTVNLCDVDWAPQLGAIARYCRSNAGTGGYCTSPDFTVSIRANPAVFNPTSGTNPSIIINQGVESSTSTKAARTPDILGSVFGILVVISVLVAVWLWKRRQQARLRLKALSHIQPYRETLEGQIELRTSAVEPPTPDRALPNRLSGNLNLMQTKSLPQPGLSGSQNSSLSRVSTLERTTSIMPRPIENPFPHINLLDLESNLLELPLGSHSISARDLARASAPNLSEHDIIRLADTIVARIHTVAPPVTSQGMDDGFGLVEDPPPAWRSSWGRSDRGGDRSDAEHSQNRNSRLNTERRVKVTNAEGDFV